MEGNVIQSTVGRRERSTVVMGGKEPRIGRTVN